MNRTFPRLSLHPRVILVAIMPLAACLAVCLAAGLVASRLHADEAAAPGAAWLGGIFHVPHAGAPRQHRHVARYPPRGSPAGSCEQHCQQTGGSQASTSAAGTMHLLHSNHGCRTPVHKIAPSTSSPTTHFFFRFVTSSAS